MALRETGRANNQSGMFAVSPLFQNIIICVLKKRRKKFCTLTGLFNRTKEKAMRLAIRNVVVGTDYLCFSVGARIWEVVVADGRYVHHYACQTGDEVEALCLTILTGWGFQGF